MKKCPGVDSLVLLAGVLVLIFMAFCMLVLALEHACWGGFTFCVGFSNPGRMVYYLSARESGKRVFR